MTLCCLGVALIGLDCWTISRITQKFDPILGYLAGDVGVEPHDARIDVADPRSDDGLFDAIGQALRNERMSKRVQFALNPNFDQHAFQCYQCATL